jgi:hypothetical protein
LRIIIILADAIYSRSNAGVASRCFMVCNYNGASVTLTKKDCAGIEIVFIAAGAKCGLAQDQTAAKS